MISRYWAIITIFAITAVSGCTPGKSVRPSEPATLPPGGPVGPTGISSGEMGPPLPPGGAPIDATVGPQPAPDFTPPKDGYVLVLGPGLARGLAYIGVLRELEERAIPVRAIVGVEIGAVVGGIWGGSTLNNLEWEMHKFKRDTLLDFPILGLSNKVAEGKKLSKFLNEALKIDLLQKTKIPVLVVSGIRGAPENTVVESNGSAREIIRGAMGIPGILNALTYDGKERFSAALETPFPVDEAKRLGLGKSICVDAVGRGDNFTPKESVEEHLATLMRSVSAIARQELKDCDVVLSIPTDGVSYLNFDAKADLIYQGRLAVQKWLGARPAQ